MDHLKLRERNQSFFRGRGLDIGPFDKPFIKNPEALGLEVETVDRWSPDDLKRLFPEIKDSFVPVPTHIFDVSKDGLGFVRIGSYDFVICSHVIEHFANPFWLIRECYRVLKTMGVLYMAAPDGRFSDDEGRQNTSYDYLLNIFRRGVRSIPDERVMDYLISSRVCKGWVKEAIDSNSITEEILENERRRSFHVHVWNSVSFLEHFARFSEDANLCWELLDLFLWENNLYESVIIVRKSDSPRPKDFRSAVEQHMKQRLRQGRDISDGYSVY